MVEQTGIVERVRTAAGKRILYLPHAINAMARPTPMISGSEVEAVVIRGEVIEDYPEDVRGHSCLMLASPESRAVHVVCSPTLMQCLHCKGRLVRGTAPFSIDRAGYHLHWDAIPAWVCSQCGEPLFEDREVDVIQDAIKALDRENERLLAAR